VPNTKSAKKDLLVSERNHERNQAVKSRLKTLRTKALAAVSTDVAASEDAVKLALKAFDSAATKGIIHPNTANRRKSRLMKRVNAAKAAGA
jgi:small subunit ribosomal protein S20